MEINFRKLHKKKSNIKSFSFIIFVMIFINKLSNSNCEILRDLIVFNSDHYRAGSISFNSNGDMIIEYSYRNSRLFYGLKKNGKGYFKNNNNETTIKTITIGNDVNSNLRYESRSAFISLNNDNNNGLYFFNIGVSSITELINLDTEEIKKSETFNFLEEDIYSYAFSLLSLESQKIYFLIFLSESNKNCIIKKLSFSDFELNSGDVSTSKILPTHIDNRIVNGFIFNDKIIIFYLNNHSKYVININNLDISNHHELEILISIGELDKGYGLFFKGLHIKDNLMGLIYFKSKKNNALEIKIALYEESFNTLKDKLTKSFDDYYFNYKDILNDFIKINDQKLAYIGILQDSPNKFKILLFDLYNNYENMNIREYELELSDYKINQELLLNVYNGYLILSSTVIDINSNSEENEDRYSILILFGYVNGTDKEMIITDYLKDDYINSENNIVNKLTENIEINNNIFKYVILRDQIKLTLIPNEILFYNNENELLANDSILYNNYNFIQNINIDKNDKFYSFDYQNIIQEADYDTFDSSAITTISISSSSSSISESQKNYYTQNYFFGRTNTIKFKLCYEYCATCKKIGIKISDQKCETCLDTYNYYYYNDSTNCVEEGYFIDKDINQKIKCNKTNSKYYLDKKSGKKICFKYEYDCPPNYPYLNKETSECVSCLYNELINKLCSFLDYNNTEIYNIIKDDIIPTYPSINGENIIINGKENYIFQLTTVKNEINIINGNDKNEYNISIIDLNKCEILLKQINNIENELIILKFEKLTNIAGEKYVQYEIFDPISKIKLNISICQDTLINLYLPSQLSEKTQQLYDNLQEQGYDLFNINDSFYLDICTKFKSENGTDVILNDRKKDYYSNERTCQEGCQFSEYSFETKNLKCECSPVSNEIITVNMEQFTGKMFLKNFYDVLKYSNYRIIKCYNLIFNINVISKNIGSIIVIVYFVLYLVFLCLYIIRGLSPLKISELLTQLEAKNISNNNLIKKTNYTHIITLKNKNSEEKNNIKNKSNEFKRKNKRYNTPKSDNKDKKNNKVESNKHIITNIPPKKKN